MKPSLLANAILLRGIGAGLVHYDHIRIVSTRSVGALKKFLPQNLLRMLSYSFEVTRYKGKDPRLRSNIDIVAPQGGAALSLLLQHAPHLANYRVTKTEVAIDIPVLSIERASKITRTLVSRVDKPWHQRGFLRSVHNPYKRPRRGLISELPTIYYEDRRASVALKCYTRHIKRPLGQLGGLCVRLEWTLSGKRALQRHLGGNLLQNLLHANLRAFVNRNLRLVQVDYVAFGKLFMSPQSKANVSGPNNPRFDPNYRAGRVAYMRLRLFADRNRHHFADEDQALWICGSSPAQIRGYCFEQRDRHALTDYRIRACFPRV